MPGGAHADLGGKIAQKIRRSALENIENVQPFMYNLNIDQGLIINLKNLADIKRPVYLYFQEVL